MLALGDDEAHSSGYNPTRDKLLLLFASGVACSAAVSVSGIVGLYGLLIPHIVRMVFGVDNRKTLPLSIMLGGSILVLIDTLARSIMLYELPIGIFTILLGAPVFLYLMKKSHLGWEQ